MSPPARLYWCPGAAVRAGPGTGLGSAWPAGRSGAAPSAGAAGWPAGGRRRQRERKETFALLVCASGSVQDLNLFTLESDVVYI